MINCPGGRLLAVATAGASLAILAFSAATVPQIRVLYALPGDTTRTTGTIVIDPPLRLSPPDAAGFLHLSIDAAALAITVRAPASDGSAPVVIGTRTILDVIAGANIITALTDTGSSIALQISAPGWCNFDAQGSLTGCTAATTFGRGFLVSPPRMSSLPGCGPAPAAPCSNSEILLDSDWIHNRVPPPIGGAVPGTCPMGESSYFKDSAGYVYECFPNADASGFVLRRSPQWQDTW